MSPSELTSLKKDKGNVVLPLFLYLLRLSCYYIVNQNLTQVTSASAIVFLLISLLSKLGSVDYLCIIIQMVTLTSCKSSTRLYTTDNTQCQAAKWGY